MSFYRNLVWFTRGIREYTKSGFEAASAKFDPTELDGIRLDNRRVLITGANSGIGLACCKELVKRGAEIHMVCRNLQRGDTARAEVLGCVNNANAVSLSACLLAASLILILSVVVFTFRLTVHNHCNPIPRILLYWYQELTSE
ncbi:Dehydrogenase/reductase SDR family member 12 [Fasciola gigantica]|uniref:Dehydrogenase/reductase SDR family member 12 n=1 Tax=Fasciola gigantica TaxID=46835 RepID=A0A504Z1E9_FASGI|nr:Dehydrogenase/reductase SDR family member 12 [Fasciola gigantica]